MKKVFALVYDVVTGELKIESDDFTTFEALGILEGAKAMVINEWFEDEDE